MRLSSDLSAACRFGAYLTLLLLLGLVGAQGQVQARDLRIGLQTAKPEVRLQGTTALRVAAEGMPAVTVPADTAITIVPKDAGAVQVLGADGAQLLAASGTVRVQAEAPVSDIPQGTNALPPMVRLLGPTRHYDGKPDRPYRGAMEILPRPEGLTVVNVVNLEEYLWSVISSEMSPDYPLEALKAQAVAARTYALRNLGRFAKDGFDLDDTPVSQVYGGYFREDPRTTQAVNETAGMVLTYKGDYIMAIYSSTCGGFTESAQEAWGTDIPYLISQPDADPTGQFPYAKPADEAGWAAYFKSQRGPICQQPKYANPEAFRWVKLMTRKEVEAALGDANKVGTVKNITVQHRGGSGRITALQVEGTDRTVTLTKELNIRRAFGNLRSSAFTVDVYRDDQGTPVVFAFWGGGWGHGLGMCQVGAVGLATEGWTFDRILAHYYPGTTLEKR